MIDAEEIGVVYRIPVLDLKPHPLNPYQVRDDDAMEQALSYFKNELCEVFGE